jgi:hypothetical protein
MASIAGSHVETVGYRRDKQKISGETKKNLVAAEERRVLTVELALYEISSDRVVYGPIRLDAEADYDYLDGDSMQDLAFKNPLGIQQTVLPFSLGQLEPKEAAHEAVARPLYEKIAKKIADAVLDGWEGVR